jgi:hypothetical protein
MRFKEWLILQEDAGRPGAKQGLYPPLAHQCAHYPPPDILTWGADAITYMPAKDRVFKMIYGKGILSKNDKTPKLKAKI